MQQVSEQLEVHDMFVWLEIPVGQPDTDSTVMHYMNFFAIAKARGVGPSYRIHKSKRGIRFTLPAPFRYIDHSPFMKKCQSLGVYGSFVCEDANGCLFILPSSEVSQDTVIVGDECEEENAEMEARIGDIVREHDADWSNGLIGQLHHCSFGRHN